MALDIGYRKKWEEYHLDSGVVMDSRYVDWKDVEWERVVSLVLVIRDQRYEVKNTDPNFVAFVRYRTDHIGGAQRHESWVVGWTDGKVCYLNEFNFKDGTLLKNFVRPLAEVKAFIHPRVKGRLGLNE